jgi:murein DD-endopeptidase MepM/ murein hydrolase activator NlpD
MLQINTSGAEKMMATRRKLIRILSILAAIVVLFSVIPDYRVSATDVAADTEKTLEQLQQDINKTKTTVNKYKAEEKNALKALQNVEDDLEDTKFRINKAEKDLLYLQTRLISVEKELVTADRALNETLKDYESTTKALKDKIVTIYKAGNPLYLEMLLTSEDFSDFVGKSDYLKAMVEYDRRTLDVLKEEQEKLSARTETAEKKKEELENTKAGISRLKGQLLADEESLTAKQEAKERYLAQVQKEKLKWEKELAEEEKQSRELEAIIRSKQTSRTTTSPSKLVGKMIWPVDGRISSEYGWRIHPIFRDRRFHAGIDIAVPTGTLVKVAAEGKVIESRYISGYGYTVIIDNGGGISTLYGHNSKLLVKSGNTVKVGSSIAKAGSTGFSTGPHVHFEVRENGVAKEPRNYLVRK